jgi:hypothetical protein
LPLCADLPGRRPDQDQQAGDKWGVFSPRSINERDTMSQTYDSRADTLAHIHHVRDNIDVFVGELLRRGRIHDASKLSDAEKPALDEALPLLEGVAYGSAEYQAVVDRVAPALQHHYRHNPHHPEHYDNAGVAGMDLFDVVEMMCDWMAAALRNPGDGVRVGYNVQKFGIEPQLAAIIGNTLARWPEKGPTPVTTE